MTFITLDKYGSMCSNVLGLLLLLCPLNTQAQDSELDSLLQVYEEFLENPAMYTDSTLFNLYKDIGTAFRYSNPDTSFYFYDKSFDLFNASMDSTNLGWLYSEYFYLYYIKGEYDKGLEVAVKAEQIFNKTGSISGLARAYNNKGLILAVFDDQEEAIEEYNKSLTLNREIERRVAVGSNLYNLGISYYNIEKYDLARAYFDSSLVLHQEIENDRMTQRSYSFLGEVYRAQGLYEKGLGYYQQAQRLLKDNEDWDRAFIFAGLSATYTGLGQYEQAEYFGLESYEVAESIDAKWELQRTAKILADMYGNQGKFEEAFKYQKLFTKWNETVYNEQREQNINRIRLAEQMARSAILEAENLENQQRINGQEMTNIILAVIIGGALLIIAVIVFFLSRQRKLNRRLMEQKEQLIRSSDAIRLQKDKLEQLNTTKDKILSIVSHDARAPLTNLYSLLSILDEGYDDFQMFRTLINNIKNELSRTRDMFTNVMYWARTQFEAFNADPEIINVKKIADEIVEDFSLQAEQKNIELKNKLEKECVAYADSTLVSIILRNFISNAIKFTSVGDSINIVCQPLAENTDFIAIEIRDTGIGMTPEQIEKVMSQVNFTRRGTKNESGSGFGIMICRDMIEQMQGTFSLESKADDGTTVKIMLPREKT